MAKHGAHSIEFKAQVVQEHLGGETLPSFSKRHDISLVLLIRERHSRSRIRSTRLERMTRMRLLPIWCRPVKPYRRVGMPADGASSLLLP